MESFGAPERANIFFETKPAKKKPVVDGLFLSFYTSECVSKRIDAI